MIVRPWILVLLLAGMPCHVIARQPPAEKAEKESLKPEKSWKSIGQSLWFDPEKKRLIVRTKVVLRDGALEHFLCLKGTKEHEAILATDAPPRQIHAGLLLTGAEPGHPVRFAPKFEPPTGSSLNLQVEWTQDGKIRRADAREWVHDSKTNKPLAESWVFAGSELYQDPNSKRIIYAADEGDLITVANFGSAILDLPFASSADNADRMFMAETKAIPELGTEVFLSMKPREDATPRTRPSKK